MVGAGDSKGILQHFHTKSDLGAGSGTWATTWPGLGTPAVLIRTNGDKEGAEGLWPSGCPSPSTDNTWPGLGQLWRPPDSKEVVPWERGGVWGFPAASACRGAAPDLQARLRPSGGVRAGLRLGLGGLPADGGVGVGVGVGGVPLPREEGVPERGVLRRRAGPSST